MTSKMPRVLLLAEACNPDLVSVPLVGWSHSQAISRHADAMLVTQVRNRESILWRGLKEGSDFVAIDSEAVASPLCRMSNLIRGGAGKGWTTSIAVMAPAYYYFERLAWNMFQKDLIRGRFDIVHRLTPLSPTMPSLFLSQCAKLGVPFIVGPLNGGVPWPKGFDSTRRAEKEWLSYIRNVYKFLPGYWETLRNSSKILCGSRYTMSQIPRPFSEKCVYMPENAVEPGLFARFRTPGPRKTLRAIFVGRLVPYKGADMLIEACEPFIRRGGLKLLIVGDGPEMGRLKKMAEPLGDGVELPGWVAHEKVQDLLCESDLFVFPSVREFGGAVVMEAMATGVPAIVADYAGPGETVTEEVGWKAKMGTRQEIVEGFKKILEGILADPGIVDIKGARAREYVLKNLTWDSKARKVVEIYREVLSKKAVDE